MVEHRKLDSFMLNWNPVSWSVESQAMPGLFSRPPGCRVGEGRTFNKDHSVLKALIWRTRGQLVGPVGGLKCEIPLAVIPWNAHDSLCKFCKWLDTERVGHSAFSPIWPKAGAGSEESWPSEAAKERRRP